MLPPRPFVLPGLVGWFCNLVSFAPHALFNDFVNLWLIRHRQLGIAYVIVTTVLFLFPPDLPVTGSNMSTSSYLLDQTDLSQQTIVLIYLRNTDYCIVAFFIVIVISVFQWFVDGRKNYKGPQIELVGDDMMGEGYQHGNGTMVHDELVEADGNGIGELDGKERRAELKG